MNFQLDFSNPADNSNTNSSSDSAAELLSRLNSPQQEAVKHKDGPILVLAGAGSGKTRVLTHRVAYLIRHYNVPPDRVLAVTFTNKASGEMRDRLNALLGDDAKRVWISTFHSACLKILRHNARHLGYTNDFVVYDEDDSRAVLKEILKTLSINEQEHPVSGFSRAIDWAKNNLLSPMDMASQKHSVKNDLQAQV